MADLHARLLDATTPLLAGEHYSTARLNGPLAALRAVVELHAPEQHYAVGQDNKHWPTWLWCRRCRQKSPCEELQVIAEQLGVEIEDKSITEKESPTNV